MSDGTRVKLNLPPWHIPYLEKHKILELFHELARELVIQQPVDHLMFVKQLLYKAAHSIGMSRVVILQSPKVNALEVAKQIAQQTNHFVITEDMVLANCGLQSRDQLTPGALVVCLSYMLHTAEPQNHGWILVDCIKTIKEAEKMLQAGIIPTHVLHLIPPFMPDLKELLYCNVHEYWPAYRREVMGIRELFKNKLVEIFLRQRFIHEVVKECIEVIEMVKGLGCPKQVRCVIIGPRGSGRKTQALLLAQKMNMIHIDFPRLLCQAWNAQNEFGDELRAQKEDVCFRSDLMSQVVNRRVLEEDCLARGWVMTGFPFSVADFKYLDSLDTPPNRVIFLECDLNVCRERVVNRRMNVYSGSITDIIKEPETITIKRLEIHPKDKIGMVNAEVLYHDIIGEENSYLHRTWLYLAASASGEFIADIGLCPFESAKVKIQTTPGFANTFGEAVPKMYGQEGFMAFYKSLPPLWLRQIPYTMVKFACFERTLELLYKYVVPKPRADCSKGEQLLVTFAAGYIAGVFCAIVSHPADTVVSKLNQEKGLSAAEAFRRLGLMGRRRIY